MAYRNNSSKFWTGFLAVLLVLVIAGTAALVGVLSDGFKNWDKFKTDEEQTEEMADNGAPVTDENGDELESDTVIPMPKAMTFRSAAALDGEDAQYGSVTLKATVKPDYVEQSVSWSVAFVDSSDEWATGKTVTDYVTVTPTEVGSTTATVQCLQPFGAQIKVVVASTEDSTKTAECTVDFQARLVDITIKFNFSEGNSDAVSMVNGPTKDSPSKIGLTYFEDITYETPIIEYSDYTVECDDTVEVFFVEGSDFSLVEDAYYGEVGTNEINLTNSVFHSFNLFVPPASAVDNYFFGDSADVSIPAFDNPSESEEVFRICNALDGCYAESVFALDFRVNSSSVKKVDIWSWTFDMPSFVTGVELDDSSIIV